MPDENNDFIVTALLSELKEENERKSRIIHALVKVVCGCIVAVLLTVGGFLWYLNQYDFSTEETTTITQNSTGVYSLIDSEGNVIASDLTPEEVEQFMEAYDGYGTSDESLNQEAKQNTLEVSKGD